MRRGLGLNRVSKKRAAQGPAYEHTVQRVFVRAKGRCEVVLNGVRCEQRAVDPHHCVPRSAGGPDTVDNLLAVCRHHHARVDWPYDRGRLITTALGEQRFACGLVFATDKFAARE